MSLARDGFVSLGRVLEGDALAPLRAATDRLLAGLPSSSYGLIRHDAWRLEPVFEEALRASPLVARAAAALGADALVLFQDHVIDKPPGTDAEVAWHQDYGYWPLASPRGLTVWFALDDA